VNCTPILVYFSNNWKTAAEMASDEIIIDSAQKICDFPLLTCLQSYCDISLTALENVLKLWYQKKSILQEQKISNSLKATVNKQLATESL